MAKKIELREARRITSDRASFRRPSWSADGRRLVVEGIERTSGEGRSALYLLDGKGRIERRLGEGAEGSWSPDGGRIAYTRDGADGRREVWVCDVATEGQGRRLAGGDGGAWEHPAWSPDGAKVACSSDYGSPAGVRHLWMLDAVQGDRSRVTSDPQRSDGHPAWSPDGRAIAFDGDDRADDAREIDVYVLALENGAVARLTDGTVATRRPVFLDRRYLVAERRSVSGPALVVLDRDKPKIVPVGEKPDGEREPAVRIRRKARVELAYVRRSIDEGHDEIWLASLAGVKVMTEEEAAEEALEAAQEALQRVPLPTLGKDDLG